MRIIALCLAGLLILIQYPLWLGKGGWLRVWEMEKQVAQAHKKNDELKARNATLESEVADLKQGTESIEERARFELGMIKDDEVFVQVVDGGDEPSRIPRSPDAPAAQHKATAAPIAARLRH
ncbi:cell division protein FtsB [Massilia sp. W12]|uniref:cell division protein FtsB n=1 Tax=Massilia sp. W12 TaxID=3126507 RepID=UPI0030CB1864